ncbi:aldose epimerase family protein [Sphingomonas sp. 1P08PE]|uniref:aldose epimerase family protein n=1 Tax=Sphingomonas sp. 1P08PE TaxID=554122 RepID=UPI0039A25D18
MAASRFLTLASPGGVAVTLTDLGARLTRIDAPDRDGRNARVLLGFDRVEDYAAEAGQGSGVYLGATCGRVANRIAGAAFELDGTRYPLAANEGANQLHGGPIGFDRVIWRVVEADRARIVLCHDSPDGDQGYPGALAVTATFTLSADGELAIVYQATTTRPTHVNIVSHGYFNLSGVDGTTIADHRLRLAADAYLPVDDAAIPTGERRVVAGTPFDFTRPRTIGEAWSDKAGEGDDPQIRLGRGYNHNLCLSGTGLREVAWLDHPASGRTLTLSTDRPGLQLYSGGWLSGRFPRHGGLCLEAQDWPDACNRPDFPATRLDPGMTYRSETRLRFGVTSRSPLTA